MLEKGIFARKLIHFFTGIALFLLTYFTVKSTLLWIIAGGSFFAFATYPIKKFSFLHKTTYRSFGTLFYPLGILSAYLVLYNFHLNYFRIALLLLTVSDTAANLTGNIIRRNIYFRVTREKKSLFGLAAFALTAWIIFYLLLPASLSNNIFYVIFLILASINLEVISFRGSDNLSIPLGMALIFNSGNIFSTTNFIFLIIVIIVMATGSYLLYKWRFLTRPGSLNAYLLGVYLMGILGVEWTIPVIFFFMSSVLFTKLNAHANKKPSLISQPRNSWQVIANSLAAVVFSAIFLFTQNSLYIFLFIASVAAFTADTWASEIGPIFNRKCLSLASFKTGKAGISGGISVAGSLAAFLGALSVAVLSYYLFFNELNIRMILIITLSGFFASFTDSILGAFIEPFLLKKNNFSNEYLNSKEKPTPNDLVNILGSLSASLFFILMW